MQKIVQRYNNFLKYASFASRICVNSFVLLAKLSFFMKNSEKYFDYCKLFCIFAAIFVKNYDTSFFRAHVGADIKYI